MVWVGGGGAGVGHTYSPALGSSGVVCLSRVITLVLQVPLQLRADWAKVAFLMLQLKGVSFGLRRSKVFVLFFLFFFVSDLGFVCLFAQILGIECTERRVLRVEDLFA